MIRTLIKESRNQYKNYKKLSENDRYILRDLFWYYLYLFLTIPCLYIFFDGKGFTFLIFAIIDVIMALWSLKYLNKNKKRLIELSEKFKYSAKQIVISIIKTYNCEG